MHLSHIKLFKQTASERSHVDYSVEGLLREYEQNGIALGIGMGLTETDKESFPDRDAKTPMGLDMVADYPSQVRVLILTSLTLPVWTHWNGLCSSRKLSESKFISDTTRSMLMTMSINRCMNWQSNVRFLLSITLVIHIRNGGS